MDDNRKIEKKRRYISESRRAHQRWYEKRCEDKIR